MTRPGIKPKLPDHWNPSVLFYSSWQLFGFQYNFSNEHYMLNSQRTLNPSSFTLCPLRLFILRLLVSSLMSRFGNWAVMLRLKDIRKRVIKVIKRVKDYSYWERLEKIGLPTFLERRTRSDLIVTFKIINRISNYHIYQPLRSGRIWHKVIFKQNLTGLNSEFSFS